MFHPKKCTRKSLVCIQYGTTKQRKSYMNINHMRQPAQETQKEKRLASTIWSTGEFGLAPRKSGKKFLFGAQLLHPCQLCGRPNSFIPSSIRQSRDVEIVAGKGAGWACQQTAEQAVELMPNFPTKSSAKLKLVQVLEQRQCKKSQQWESTGKPSFKNQERCLPTAEWLVEVEIRKTRNHRRPSKRKSKDVNRRCTLSRGIEVTWFEEVPEMYLLKECQSLFLRMRFGMYFWMDGREPLNQVTASHGR